MKKIIICIAIFVSLLSATKINADVCQDLVCFNEHCYNVELAISEVKKSKGLQHRATLNKDHGMLFAFSYSAKHAFWMKDTLIPLDMIWLDYNHQIVDIKENVQPCPKDPCPSYIPSRKAMFVLEVNANETKALSLKKGDMARFKICP